MKLLLQKIQQKSSPTKNYWLPKLHKNLIKARFIIAATTSACTIILNQVNVYNKLCSYFSGVNSFWTILNNQPALESINKRNGKGNTSSISCFDFSTSYTKIPHNKSSKFLMNWLIFILKDRMTNSYLLIVTGVNGQKNEGQPAVAVFTKSSMKRFVKYLLKNCYFNSGIGYLGKLLEF